MRAQTARSPASPIAIVAVLAVEVLLLAGLVRVGRLGLLQQVVVAVALVGLIVGALAYAIAPWAVLAAAAMIVPLLSSDPATKAVTVFAGGVGAITLLVAPAGAARPVRPIVVPLLGWAGIGALSAWLNDATSLNEVFRSVALPLLSASLVGLVFIHLDTPRKVDRFIQAALIGGFLVALHSVVLFAIGGQERVAGTFEFFNQLGGFMLLVSLPTIGYLVSARTAGKRWFYGVAFLTQLLAMILSLTLGSVFSLLAVILVGTIVLGRANPGRAVAYLVVLSSVLAAIWFATPALREKVQATEERAGARLATYTTGMRVALGNLWWGAGSQEKVLEIIVTDPEVRVSQFGEATYPHNAFLTIWAANGILALAFITLAVLGALRLLMRQPPVGSREYWLHLGLALGAGGFLLQNLTNNLLIGVRISPVFFMLVAAAVRLSHDTRREWRGEHQAQDGRVRPVGAGEPGRLAVQGGAAPP